MPLSDLTENTLTPEVATTIIGNLTESITALNAFAHNISPDERRKYGSIKEANKLVVNKVKEYNEQQPSLSTPDVDWDEFNNTYTARAHHETIENLLKQLMELCSDKRILHDYELYRAALTDYDYTQYKAKSASGGGYTAKMQELEQFFKKQPAPEPNPEP